jgi:hypothetical protein
MWAEANQYNPLHPPRDSEKTHQKNRPFFHFNFLQKIHWEVGENY